jgi:hypothetical protein
MLGGKINSTMITHCRVAYSVKFFADGFLERWGLVPYSQGQIAPTIFVGAYATTDINAILNHKGKKVVMLLGGDLPNIDKLKHDKSITFVADKKSILEYYSKHGVKFFDGVIPLKDFSEFNQAPKGDKIYCYVNQGTDSHLSKHGVTAIQPVINYFGKDKFIFGTHGKSQSEVIKEYYLPSAVNLQLNQYAGFTSSLEMAHMGRKTISNTKAPFAIPFKTHADIIEAIQTELSTPTHENLIGDYLCMDKQWMRI